MQQHLGQCILAHSLLSYSFKSEHGEFDDIFLYYLHILCPYIVPYDPNCLISEGLKLNYRKQYLTTLSYIERIKENRYYIESESNFLDIIKFI